MDPARWRRRLGALLIAPVLAFAVSASSFSALRCTLSGMFVPETCCPTAMATADDSAPDANASVGEPGCCQRVVVANAKAPAVSSPRAQHDVLLIASLAALPTVGWREPVTFRRREPAGAALARPPGRAAPVFLLTSTLLI